MYFEQAHLMSKEKKDILLPKMDAAHSEEGHMPSTFSVSSCHEVSGHLLCSRHLD